MVPSDKTANNTLQQLFYTYLKQLGKKIHSKCAIDLFYVANRIQLNEDVKNKLISQKNNAEMNCFLINEIRFLQKLREQEEQLNKKFHLN